MRRAVQSPVDSGRFLGMSSAEKEENTGEILFPTRN